MNEGFSFTPWQILIAIHQVLIEICNGNHDWHVLVYIQVFSTCKCEAVNFPKFELACVHARPLGYLDTPFLFRAHVPCMHMHNVHTMCMPDMTSQGS